MEEGKILSDNNSIHLFRKRVTYSMIEHHKISSHDPKSEDPRTKEVRLSSYFKRYPNASQFTQNNNSSCKSVPMMNINDKWQKEAGINDQFKSKIMPKNCRYHMLFNRN